MREIAAAVLVAACLECAGSGNDTQLSVNGRFCLGDNYEVWSGEEANTRLANCEAPVSAATFAVELTDGSRLQAETDSQGYFFLQGIPSADLELLLFDGGIIISGFGPGSVLQSGPNELFVELPPSFCRVPDEMSDQDDNVGSENLAD